MNIIFSLLLFATIFTGDVWTKDCAILKSNTKLFCYYGDVKETNDYCRCSHVILPENTEPKTVEKIRKRNEDVKILITVREFNQKLVNLLKGTRVDGVELNLKKIDSKNDMSDFVSTVKSKLGTDLYVAVAVPPKTEVIAKYFDFKELAKTSDAFVLNTAFLGASQNVTFHPSRLSGLWDVQNTDSMVDLVSGLGAPLSKLVITAPVQAYKFTLQNEEYTAPGCPATEVKSINRNELCDKMTKKGEEWTLERDQDQAGAYIFRKKEWISFEDETSIDIKTKYARVRGLAGVALKDLSQDAETKCGPSLLEAAFKGLSKQARAPRGAVLHTLEREILSSNSGNGGSVHASPFRITRVIDTEGKIHVIRQDTRTEFECSRQGYFVHPRSCNRFYRCVKFDQRTDEYNVFEFDCPAGLTFDEKTEVCVWPGSIPHSSACSGSSEIAPVPKKRFTCPTEPGYYADPENCRWFFACLDHGEASMQAYEFRCPFGLVFDEDKLLCEWSWLVPKCGTRIGTITVDFYGGASTNINQYDGLGVLQTVKLGGLQGYIPVAESKTYSNVGRVGTTQKLLNHNQIGENSAQFIDASKRLGLSFKATQSLFNAGLLNSDLSGDVLKQSQGTLNFGGLAQEVNSELSGAQYNLNVNNLEFVGSRNQDGNYVQNSDLNRNNYEAISKLDSSGVEQGASLEAIQGIQRVSLNAGLNENAAQNNFYITGNSQVGSIGQGALNVDVSGQYQNIGRQNFGNNGYSSSKVSSDAGLNENLAQNNVYITGNSQVGSVGQGALNVDVSGQYQNIDSQNFGINGYSSSKVSSNAGLNENLAQNNVYITGNSQVGPVGQGALNVDVSGQYQNIDRQNFGLNGYSSSKVSLNTGLNENLAQSNVYTTGNSQVGLVGQDALNIDVSGQFNNINGYSTSNNGLGQDVDLQFGGKLVTSDLNRQSVGGGKSFIENIQITQNSESINAIPQVTPSSVSYTTASSFDSIVAATPLQKIDIFKQNNARIEGAHQASSFKFENARNNLDIHQSVVSDSSYSYGQRDQPRFVSSTISSIPVQPVQINLQQEYREPQVFLKQPEVYSSSTAHVGSISGFEQKTDVKPVIFSSTFKAPTILENTPQQSFKQQTPLVSLTSAGEQGILDGSSSSQENGYTYEKPSVVFEEGPQAVVSSTPNSVVIPSSGTSYRYSNQKLSSGGRPKAIQPVFIGSIPPTASSNYYRQDINTGYVHKVPQIVAHQPQVFVSSTVRPIVKEEVVSPHVQIVKEPKFIVKQPQAVLSTYNYNAPKLQLEQRQQVIVEQPQVLLQQSPKIVENYSFIKPAVQETLVQVPQVLSTGSSQSYARQETGGYKYEKPIVSFEEKPQLVLQKQPQVFVSSTPATSNYYRQDSHSYEFPRIQQQSVTTLRKPVVQLESQQILLSNPQVVARPQKVVENYNFVKQVVQPQVIVQKPQVYVSSTQIPILQQTVSNPSITQSFSNFNQDTNAGYTYEKPQVVFEEKPQTKTSHSTSYNFNQNFQVDDKSKVLVKPQNNVESYSYVQPDLRSEILVNQPQFYVSSTQTPFIQNIEEKPSAPQSFTYTSQKSNDGYKYEKPQIVFEETPKINLKFTKPSLSTSNNVNTDYTYKRPSAIFEQKPQVLVKQEFERPTFSYQYQPVVQQPRGFSKLDFQEAAVQSYSYSSPIQPQYIVKPATILSTTYRTPVSVKTQNIEFKGYGYPRPNVQFAEEPNVLVTNYEDRIPVAETPIIPQKAYITGKSYRYQNNVQRIKQQEPIKYYTSPRPSYVSTINSIVAQKKTIQVPTQEVVYYDSRLENPKVQTQYFQYSTPATSKIVGYDYPKPRVQFNEQKLVPVVKEPERQVVQYTYSTPRPTYLSTVKSVLSQKIEPIQQNFVYYDSRLSTTPAAQIQYLESTTVKPLATVTTSYLPSFDQKVEKVKTNEYIYPKPQVNLYQYKNEAVSFQKQLNVLNQQYIEPQVQISYQTSPKPTYQSTLSAVIPKKPASVDTGFTYYDSRYTSETPNIQYVKTSTTSAPEFRNNQKVEFEGYNYPKPQRKFEEGIVVTSYENKVPVNEELIVPKKAYVTTGESYTYNQKAEVDVKPIVLEDYKATNYHDYSSRQKVEEVYYTTPKPTYTSTLATVLSQKLTPLEQGFVYYDSRLSSTSKPQLQYLERSKIPTRVTVTSPVVQRVEYVENDFKNNVQYSEQPERVLTNVEINQPSIIENYVSPKYQKYETPLPSSTVSSILDRKIQPIKPKVLFYDSRLSTPETDIVKVSDVPRVRVQPEIKITTPSPVIVQKLEQDVPVEPFYYYDSRLSTTQAPNVEISRVQTNQPQFVEQKLTNVEGRYSSTVRPSLEPEIEYRPRVKVVKQKKLFRPAVEIEKSKVEYSIGSSTPKLGVIYAEIETKEPSSTYLPIRKRIKSTTQPSREYLPTKTTYRPSVQYLPSRTSTVSNEYLPISSSESPAVGGISVENYQNFELVRKKSRPVKVVKIVRPRVKTVVIKKNDYNPFLSAKLGAQCTCTSNTLELRKEQLKIEVPDYDDDVNIEDDDDDAILVTKNDGEAIVVENYEADQKDDSVTPEPEIYIKSSTAEVPSSTYRVRKVSRGRSRAQNVLIESVASRKSGRVNIEASEVSISARRVKVKTPRVDINVDEGSEENVRSKSRSKSVEVKDNDVEVTSGNAGILSGVDCQRAGLFRHPTQCNKFYSCRWDCKKNKFTLHVFNCPVHLTFDNNLGACNWPSQGPACLENTLLPSE